MKSIPSISRWLQSHSRDLHDGGRWLWGTEAGRPDPAGFERAHLRLLFCRLSPYDDTAPSITHRLLMCATRRVPGLHVDFAFFPPESDAALMINDGIPLWLATGAKRPPADFDVVAISLSVLQEAVNLPAALHFSGLRLDFASRMADPRHPLIILGGHSAGSAAFIHGDAVGENSGGLVDAVCLGDGIRWLPEFLQRWQQHRRAGGDKISFLEQTARELSGTYVPAFYLHRREHDQGRLTAIEPQRPRLPLPVVHRCDPLEEWLADYDGGFLPCTPEENEETLPLTAGCAYRCRFCQTSWLRARLEAPRREMLLAAARRLKAAMVPSDLNLLASDAGSLAELDRLIADLAPLFRRLSLKSLSATSLVRQPAVLALLRRMEKTEFTFGIEGISARLRAWLGKPTAADDLFALLPHLTAGGGLRQMKLFFIATGREEERDFEEFARLLDRCRSTAPRCRRITSFMPLFCAPFTPLQYTSPPELSSFLIQNLERVVTSAAAEFRWSARPEEIALLHRLCHAGRSATAALVEFSLRHRLRFYETLSAGPAKELCRQLPPPPAVFSATAVFPWSDLQAGAAPAVLWKSFQQANQDFAAAPPRPSPAESKPARAGALGSPNLSPEPIRRISFFIWIPPEWATQPDHLLVRRRLREVFGAWPEGIGAYRGNPCVWRPPGSAGWLPAAADFIAGTPLPPSRPDLVPISNAAPATSDRLIFALRLGAPEILPQILEVLRRERVKFQTLRRGDTRWQLVNESYRSKTGIWALQEEKPQPILYCHARRLPLQPAEISHPSAVFAVLAPEETRCPACRSRLHRPWFSDRPQPTDVCLDCLQGFPPF